MTEKGHGVSPMRWFVVALLAIASTGALALAMDGLLRAGDGSGVRDRFTAAPVPTAAALALPFLVAWLAALVVRAPRTTSGGAPGRAAASDAAAQTVSGTRADKSPAPPSGAAALQLLAVLQQEGRFVDFIEEDLTSYSDEQIGAAVRSIHDGCRSALHDRLELRPVLAAAEGATVTVERGFDPAAVRVTGNVRGEPPYRGVVRHPGWRSDGVKLPERTGDGDASILAPAEVEVL
jgi:hypothetical protein